MRLIKVSMLVLFLCFGIATMGWSIYIVDNGGPWDGRNVGSVDNFLGDTNDLGNSNWSTETAWANTILDSETAVFQVKDDPIAYFPTNTTDVYAFKMDPLFSEYFIIKNAGWWALFENQDKLEWGVFDVSDLPLGINLGGSDDFEISHVTRFNPVPEPGTILLLGAGLFGLVAVSRRNFRK